MVGTTPEQATNSRRRRAPAVDGSHTLVDGGPAGLDEADEGKALVAGGTGGDRQVLAVGGTQRTTVLTGDLDDHGPAVYRVHAPQRPRTHPYGYGVQGQALRSPAQRDMDSGLVGGYLAYHLQDHVPGGPGDGMDGVVRRLCTSPTERRASPSTWTRDQSPSG